MEPMTMMLVASAASSVVSGLVGRSNEARAARRERDARVLENSARSKALGAETVMEGQRNAEQSANTLRQSLQLTGAARASADSAGISGNSADALVRDIEMQALNAMAIARVDADNKIGINRMSNKAAYESTLFTTSTFKPQSMMSIIGSAALNAAVTYASAKAMGGGNAKG